MVQVRSLSGTESFSGNLDKVTPVLLHNLLTVTSARRMGEREIKQTSPVHQ